MGLTASLQHQDIGLIPGLAQWVKGSGVGCNCCSDLIPGPGTFICHRCSHKKGKEKGRKGREGRKGKRKEGRKGERKGGQKADVNVKVTDASFPKLIFT